MRSSCPSATILQRSSRRWCSAARAAILDTFEEDTLVEAIARELERSHGFTYIGDEKLRASMSVGMEDEDNYLVEQSEEFRSIVAEMETSNG